jgi:hypothetical protein
MENGAVLAVEYKNSRDWDLPENHEIPLPLAISCYLTTSGLPFLPAAASVRMAAAMSLLNPPSILLWAAIRAV